MIAPGFERLEEVFRSHAALQQTGGLAFAATLDGEPIVDLVSGTSHPGRPWTSDTRTGVASISKGWSMMVVHRLMDRGLFTLDTRVAELWPEFAANGKDRITVRQIVEHTAGVIGLPDASSLLGWDGTGWDDLDGIAERLAASTPAWEPGTRCGYHAVSFGWLVGEIVRRTDGRTLGTVFREELAEPLGIRTAIGVPVAEHPELAEHQPGTGELLDIKLLRPILKKVPQMMRDPKTLVGRAFLADGQRSIMDSVKELSGSPAWCAAEVPASNGVSSAKDLARLYAVLANGGKLDGERYLSPAAMQMIYEPGTPYLDSVMTEFASGPILGRLIRKMGTVQRSVGGFDGNRRGAAGPNPRTVGSGGAGGQMVLADPDARVSAAFVRSEFGASMTSQAALVKTLFECLSARPAGAAR